MTLVLGNLAYLGSVIIIIIIIIISGLHHYECVAPLATNNLQSGRF